MNHYVYVIVTGRIFLPFLLLVVVSKLEQKILLCFLSHPYYRRIHTFKATPLERVSVGDSFPFRRYSSLWWKIELVVPLLRKELKLKHRGALVPPPPPP